MREAPLPSRYGGFGRRQTVEVAPLRQQDQLSIRCWQFIKEGRSEL